MIIIIFIQYLKFIQDCFLHQDNFLFCCNSQKVVRHQFFYRNIFFLSHKNNENSKHYKL